MVNAFIGSPLSGGAKVNRQHDGTAANLKRQNIPGSLTDMPENQRWLTPSERAAWVAMAAMMIKLPAALDQQMQRDADLTFFEYMVLAMLSESPQLTQRMSDLAALTSASPSRLSHVASRLERAGFLARQRCPGRGRSTNAVLTDAGCAKVVAAAPAHVAAVREYFIDALTPDQLSTLSDIAGQVRLRLDPDGPWGPPGP
jgi:DNA-binding MarR family transcriptional regulator